MIACAAVVLAAVELVVVAPGAENPPPATSPVTPTNAPAAAEPAAEPDDSRAITPTEVGPPPAAQAAPPVQVPEPVGRVATERSGPPFYGPADVKQLRARYGLRQDPPETARTARWRCLIADPTCGFNFEINATSAYAYRVRQSSVETANDVHMWHSGRAQYDLWLNFPAVVETLGRFRYTRMTLGPKGGVMVSDGNEVWANVGFATRYWFGRGWLAPAFEFTSGLSFQLRAGDRMQRSPVGFTADVGFGLGGFGAIVVGGQYDAALAREEVPEQLRVATGGMFYVGFRGNILWGVPAAAAVTTHAVTLRTVDSP